MVLEKVEEQKPVYGSGHTGRAYTISKVEDPRKSGHDTYVLGWGGSQDPSLGNIYFLHKGKEPIEVYTSSGLTESIPGFMDIPLFVGLFLGYADDLNKLQETDPEFLPGLFELEEAEAKSLADFIGKIISDSFFDT